MREPPRPPSRAWLAPPSPATAEMEARTDTTSRTRPRVHSPSAERATTQRAASPPPGNLSSRDAPSRTRVRANSRFVPKRHHPLARRRLRCAFRAFRVELFDVTVCGFQRHGVVADNSNIIFSGTSTKVTGNCLVPHENYSEKAMNAKMMGNLFAFEMFECPYLQQQAG